MNSWTTWMTVGAMALLLGACDKKQEAPQAQANSAKQAMPGDGVDDPAKTDAMKVKVVDVRKPGMLYVDPGAAQPALVAKAVAVMQPTKGNTAAGTVMFEAVDGGGLKVTADIQGLPKGKHAYHFHVFGDCTGEAGKSAGTHFHFDGSSMNPPKDIKIITGNLGELEAGDDGKATASVTVKDASLQGFFSVLGRAVIIHEKGNDHSAPPIGAAGGRLACGVVGIANQ